MTSLGGRIPRGLVMLSQKIEKKVLDGQGELTAQPTRKSSGRLGGRKRERKEESATKIWFLELLLLKNVIIFVFISAKF